MTTCQCEHLFAVTGLQLFCLFALGAILGAVTWAVVQLYYRERKRP